MMRRECQVFYGRRTPLWRRFPDSSSRSAGMGRRKVPPFSRGVPLLARKQCVGSELRLTLLTSKQWHTAMRNPDQRRTHRQSFAIFGPADARVAESHRRIGVTVGHSAGGNPTVAGKDRILGAIATTLCHLFAAPLRLSCWPWPFR